MTNFKRSAAILAGATSLVASQWLVWEVLIRHFASARLEIGIGLGGLIYPLFFVPLVFCAALAYYWWFSRAGALPHSFAGRIFATVVLPFVVSTILLLHFCPIDSGRSLLIIMVSRVFGAN